MRSPLTFVALLCLSNIAYGDLRTNPSCGEPCGGDPLSREECASRDVNTISGSSGFGYRLSPCVEPNCIVQSKRESSRLGKAILEEWDISNKNDDPSLDWYEYSKTLKQAARHSEVLLARSAPFAVVGTLSGPTSSSATVPVQMSGPTSSFATAPVNMPGPTSSSVTVPVHVTTTKSTKTSITTPGVPNLSLGTPVVSSKSKTTLSLSNIRSKVLSETTPRLLSITTPSGQNPSLGTLAVSPKSRTILSVTGVGSLAVSDASPGMSSKDHVKTHWSTTATPTKVTTPGVSPKSKTFSPNTNPRWKVVLSEALHPATGGTKNFAKSPTSTPRRPTKGTTSVASLKSKTTPPISNIRSKAVSDALPRIFSKNLVKQNTSTKRAATKTTAVTNTSKKGIHTGSSATAKASSRPNDSLSQSFHSSQHPHFPSPSPQRTGRTSQSMVPRPQLPHTTGTQQSQSPRETAPPGTTAVSSHVKTSQTLSIPAASGTKSDVTPISNPQSAHTKSTSRSSTPDSTQSQRGTKTTRSTNQSHTTPSIPATTHKIPPTHNSHTPHLDAHKALPPNQAKAPPDTNRPHNQPPTATITITSTIASSYPPSTPPSSTRKVLLVPPLPTTHFRFPAGPHQTPLSTGTKAAAGVAAGVAVVLLALVAICLMRRRRKLLREKRALEWRRLTTGRRYAELGYTPAACLPPEYSEIDTLPPRQQLATRDNVPEMDGTSLYEMLAGPGMGEYGAGGAAGAAKVSLGARVARAMRGARRADARGWPSLSSLEEERGLLSESRRLRSDNSLLRSENVRLRLENALLRSESSRGCKEDVAVVVVSPVSPLSVEGALQAGADLPPSPIDEVRKLEITDVR